MLTSECLLCCIVVQLTQVTLPYELKDLEPNIDAQTMKFHYGTHYKAYVDNLNAATKEAGSSSARSADLSCEFAALRDGRGVLWGL